MADSTHGNKHGLFVRLSATIWTRRGHLVSPPPQHDQSRAFHAYRRASLVVKIFRVDAGDSHLFVRTQLRSQAPSASASASGVCAAVLSGTADQLSRVDDNTSSRGPGQRASTLLSSAPAALDTNTDVGKRLVPRDLPFFIRLVLPGWHPVGYLLASCQPHGPPRRCVALRIGSMALGDLALLGDDVR
ncbi:hypothetical protein OIDMADRAFT_22381 [Oidiodendron maius Zn]|uniref:Uncharacterized protein n=1 Tax=Oidiodendron maius (strain Zn) TaxID=913774 RepID=A0A0C3HX43_OIDMZ|nr:hypothetical protein OIDMADRAFT_22381 [Oidiodendron maius Zn]